jgi:hypothetical protein
MANVELRCGKRLHGILTDDGVLEVSCRSSLCGHRDGVVVIHKFDAVTGQLIGTVKYKDPTAARKEQADGLGLSTSLRLP